VTPAQQELARHVIHARQVLRNHPGGTLTPQDVEDFIEAADNLLPHFDEDELSPIIRAVNTGVF
jgi:hypothetical protein